MGVRFVPAAPSNPDGHYEDSEVVSLHDRLLASVGSSWRYHDEVGLPHGIGVEREIRQYVDRRDAGDHLVWGFKDPRASLFLPEWKRVVGSRGRFILLIRHWSQSIQSLLHRHSVTLATLANRESTKEDLSFWAQPGLLPRMWLSYSQRILEFARSHEADVLILPAEALFGSQSITDILQQRWGIEQGANDLPRPKPQLLHREVDERVKTLINPLMEQRLESVWSELIRTVPADLAGQCRDCFATTWTASNSAVAPGSVSAWRTTAAWSAREWAPPMLVMPPKETWSVEGLAQLVSRPEALTREDLAQAIEWTQLHGFANVGLLVSLAGRAIDLKAYSWAEHVLLLALAASKPSSDLHLRLGNVYKRWGRPDNAEYQFRQSISLAPANTALVGALGNILRLQGRLTEANQVLVGAIDQAPSLWTVTEWAAVSVELGCGEHVLPLLNSLIRTMPEHAAEWYELVGLIHLPTDMAEASRNLKIAARLRLADKELSALLGQWLPAIDSPSHATDLMIRILGHWSDVLGVDELNHRLTFIRERSTIS